MWNLEMGDVKECTPSGETDAERHVSNVLVESTVEGPQLTQVFGVN